MVRTMATMLCAHCPKPRTVDCEIPAKALVAKYPFLKSVHSWKTYIYNRCVNINRKRPSETSTIPKRLNLSGKITHHSYPSLSIEMDDEASHLRNITLLKNEMLKTSNQTNLCELWKRTFTKRRKDILNDPKLVVDLCDEYPVLRKTSFISIEFELILQKNHLKEQFKTNWKKWKFAILEYAKATTKPSLSLRNAFREESDIGNKIVT